jgi:UDP-glucose 4-epimerase
VAGLVGEGWRVRVLDDFSSGRQANLADVADVIEVIRGDVRDEAALARAMAGVEVVFHQAAVASVPASVADPLRTSSINLDGTLKLLEAARRARVRRVVYAASSSAYGNDEELPKRETMRPQPLSPYALQKLTGEFYCGLYADLYGLETVALRYFNVFGPRQDPKSEYAAVIPRFIVAALAGEGATIYGDGEQTRDFVYVQDAVRANLLAADAPRASGAVINIATGRRISLNELWRTIREITGVTAAARHAPARPGDVRDSVADLARARDLLGFEPAVPLREGLRSTADSFSQKPSKGEQS